MNGSYVKLFRKFDEWEWYLDINVKTIFLHLLINATFKDINFKGEKLQAGTVITGLKALSEQTNLSVQQTRTALNKLKSTNEITIKSTNKGTLIYLVNWEKYQSYDDVSNKQNNKHSNKPITNEQQTNNKQITTKEECIEYKNVKNSNKKPIGENLFAEYVSDERLLAKLDEFIQFRKEKRSPLTKSSAKYTFNRLLRLSENIEEQILIIEQSLEFGWSGLFELNKNQKNKPSVILPDYMSEESQQNQSKEITEEERRNLENLLSEVGK